jgi:hypothetical protein
MKVGKRKRKRDARIAYLTRAHEARDTEDPPISRKQWQAKAAEFETMWAVCDAINLAEKNEDEPGGDGPT